MEAALSRGWTSISEQWVNPERLDELERLRRRRRPPPPRGRLPRPELRQGLPRATGMPSREPGPVDDHLRVKGLKIHLDDGSGDDHQLGACGPHRDHRARRTRPAGNSRSMRSAPRPWSCVLDAFEAALGPTGPNPLHHRIEHALQVTDKQLARLVAMDIPTVIHLDGAADWVLRSKTSWPSSTATTPARRSAGSPAGATSSKPGCTSPRRLTRRGPSRTSTLPTTWAARRPDRCWDGRARRARARRRRRGCSISC